MDKRQFTEMESYMKNIRNERLGKCFKGFIRLEGLLFAKKEKVDL